MWSLYYYNNVVITSFLITRSPSMLAVFGTGHVRLDGGIPMYHIRKCNSTLLVIDLVCNKIGIVTAINSFLSKLEENGHCNRNLQILERNCVFFAKTCQL